MKRKETPVLGLSVSKEAADEAMTDAIRDYRIRALVWLFLGSWWLGTYLIILTNAEHITETLGTDVAPVMFDLAGLLFGLVGAVGIVVAAFYGIKAIEAERLRTDFRRRLSR